MPGSFTISLGGIPIGLIPDKLSGRYDLVKKISIFQCTEKPQLTLRVNCGWFPDKTYTTIRFDTNIAWQLFHDDGHWIYSVKAPQLVQLGIFPQDYLSGVIHVAARYYDPDLYIFPLAYPLGELFIMNLLGTGLGILTHAAGVVYKGEGYLFAGHGSVGKSTSARLWQAYPGAQVINDDKVIIRKNEEGFRIYGTPWHGEGGMALPVSAPLKSVFILKQASKNYAIPISQTQAVGMLLARSFLPIWDAEKINYSLQFLEELTRYVTSYELGFIPDPSVIDFVLNVS